MIEKPNTVLELFEGHPERLVKDPHNSHETAGGEIAWEDHSELARWCLMSAIQFVYGYGYMQPYERFCDSLTDTEQKLDGCTGFLIRNRDNNGGEYDFPAIIAKLRELGI